jgi:hypothetical protein
MIRIVEGHSTGTGSSLAFLAVHTVFAAESDPGRGSRWYRISAAGQGINPATGKEYETRGGCFPMSASDREFLEIRPFRHILYYPGRSNPLHEP